MRPLTDGEIALCRRILPDELPYAAVRLCDGAGAALAAKVAFRRGNSAITLGRTIHFALRYCSDFAAGDVETQRLFVHEMTHVWQWHRLGTARFLLRYGLDLVRAGFVPSAMYRYGARLPFAEAMLEAQAQMVGDYRGAGPARRRMIAQNLTGTGFHGL
jgi:hypothetical protein